MKSFVRPVSALTLLMAALTTVAAPAQASDPSSPLQAGDGNWSSVGSLPNFHAAGLMDYGDGRILFAGGASDRVAAFDPTNGSIENLPALPQRRLNPALLRLADGRVILASERPLDCGNNCNYQLDILDPNATSWRSVPSLPFEGAPSVALRSQGDLAIIGPPGPGGGSGFLWDTVRETHIFHENGMAIDGNISTSIQIHGRGEPSNGARNFYTAPDGTLYTVSSGPAFSGGTYVLSGTSPLKVVDAPFQGAPHARLISLSATGDDAAMDFEPFRDSVFGADENHFAVIGYRKNAQQLAAVVWDVRDGSSVIVPAPNADGCAAGQLSDMGPIVTVPCNGGYGAQIFDPASLTWREHPRRVPVGSYVGAGTVLVNNDLYFTRRTYDNGTPLTSVTRYSPGPIEPASVPSALSPVLQPCCESGVTLFWQPPTADSDGGAEVSGFQVVRVGPDGSNTFTLGPTANSFHDPDVTTPGTHTYTIAAVNAVGVGAPASVLASRGPGPVRNLTSTGSGKAVLTWDPPSDTYGALAGYDIYRLDIYANGAPPTATTGPTTTRYTDASVEAGSMYQYAVMARNEAGYTALTTGRYSDIQYVTVSVTPPTNSNPVTTPATRSVRGGQSSGLVLSASDPDDDALSYTTTDGPHNGSITGTAPNLTYSPDAGYIGPDSVTFTVDDGNGGVATGTVAITVTDPETGTSSVSQAAGEGQTVATGATPSATEPAQVAVTTPVAGAVSITQDPAVADPAGYTVLGAQYVIEAPQASVLEPLRLVFQLDQSMLPQGESADSITVFRDGVVIQPCADDSGTATPDPCVASRTLAGGVVTIVVRSSHASAWTLGVPLRATTTSLGPVADTSYGQPLTLTATVTQSGSAGVTGSVTFKNTATSPATVLGTSQVDSTGKARLTLVTLPPGTYRVIGVYSGSPTSANSTSGQQTVHVSKASVAVDVKPVSVLLSLLVGKFSFTATLTSSVTGAPVTGAAVQFKGVTLLNQSISCTAISDDQGVATCKSGSGAWLLTTIPPTFQVKVSTTSNYLAAEATGRFRL